MDPIPPFPVGNIWDPTAKRILDRFTHEHLVETALFGLRPFDEDFYVPERRALIVERTDPIQPDERTFTLAQARGEEPVIWCPRSGRRYLRGDDSPLVAKQGESWTGSPRHDRVCGPGYRRANEDLDGFDYRHVPRRDLFVCLHH